MDNYLNGIGKEFCLHCKKNRTKEGHDGCIGTLKNVKNACCGHGETKIAYVQFNHKNFDKYPNKMWLSGQDALDYIKDNRFYCLRDNVKIPTTDRCNEMIDGFDRQISKKFKTKHKYSKEERELLIKTIKENPTHFWEVGTNGLIHWSLLEKEYFKIN